jgi:hypothetical protein
MAEAPRQSVGQSVSEKAQTEVSQLDRRTNGYTQVLTVVQWASGQKKEVG